MTIAGLAGSIYPQEYRDLFRAGADLFGGVNFDDFLCQYLGLDGGDLHR